MFVRFLFFTLLALALVAQSGFTPEIETERETPGTKEDPFARDRYEFEKLKDPKTGEIPYRIRAKELAFASTLPSRERLNQNAFKGLSTQAIDWQFRGPENLGGRTRALAVDVTDENVIIAGGVSGGMWRSEDAGKSWSRTSKLSDLKSVTCLVQDKRLGHTNVWYYGTGEARANSAGMKAEYYGDGLSKSTDGGKSWQQLESTVSNTPNRFDEFDYIMNVAVDPSNLLEDEVYCATTRAIYRSTDGGINWELVLGTQGGRGAYCEVMATETGVMYATIHSGSTAGGIYRSTDGKKWVKITPGSLGLDFERVVIAASPLDETQVYFLLSTPTGGMNGNTFYKYTYIKGDGSGEGGAWEDRTQFLPPQIETYYSYCMVLQVKEDDPEVVYLGGMDLYRSTDGFASTDNTVRIGGNDYPSHHADQHVLARVPGDADIFYSGNDGGIHRTDNINESTVSWMGRSHGYVTSQFYTVAVDHETIGSDVVIGGLQDNGTWSSLSGTRNWQNIWGADGGFAKIIDQGSTVFASWQQGVIYRLDRDKDGSVTSWTRIDPANAFSYDFINPFAVDPNDANKLYVAEGQNIWRTEEALSMENGTNGPARDGWDWLRAATGQQVTALSVSQRPADILYYGTRNGSIYRLDNASNAEPPAVNISSGKGLPGGYVSSISIDPTDAQKVLVAFSNYGIQSIAFTSDGGETWSIVAGNLEEKPDGTGVGPAVKWVATLPGKTSTIYFAGTTVGLFSTYKLDGANTVWMLEAESIIGNTVVDMIDIRHQDGFVGIATHGNGMYSAIVEPPGGPVSGVASKPATPSLSLSISPNPSNGLARIGFELNEYSPVEISITDMNGRVVFTQRENMPAGLNALRWSGLDQFNRPLPSGSYALVVRTPYAEEKRRIVRIK